MDVIVAETGDEQFAWRVARNKIKCPYFVVEWEPIKKAKRPG